MLHNEVATYETAGNLFACMHLSKYGCIYSLLIYEDEVFNVRTCSQDEGAISSESKNHQDTKVSNDNDMTAGTKYFAMLSAKA